MDYGHVHRHMKNTAASNPRERIERETHVDQMESHTDDTLSVRHCVVAMRQRHTHTHIYIYTQRSGIVEHFLTSIPIFIVVVDDGHEPHAPSNLSRTTSPSISRTDTLPPSAMRYGRTCPHRERDEVTREEEKRWTCCS